MAKKKKLREYAFIAGVTIGMPLALELSGVSKAIAQRENKIQREGLVYMLNNPGYGISPNNFDYTKVKESIQKNIEYIDAYPKLRAKSARCGINAIALLLGFTGAVYTILGKRKLEELGVK